MNLGSTDLQQAKDFLYLGGTILADTNCDKDVTRQIGLAAGIVRKLQMIWNPDDINKTTKVCLYQSLIQSLLLYNSDMNTERRTQVKIEGIWNVSRKKDSRGQAMRQKVECGHTEDIGYRIINHWTPANPTANIFWSCVSYASWKISTYCIVWMYWGISYKRKT